jgi:hypothetical protein
MDMNPKARFSAGRFLVGIPMATVFFVSQSTYTYIGVCKHFNEVLNPLNVCTQEVSIPSSNLKDTQNGPREELTKVLENSASLVVSTPSATTEDRVIEPSVEYNTDPAWRNHAPQINTLLSSIVNHLVYSQERSGGDTSTTVSSGNISIRTTSPYTKLSVVGDIALTGGLSVKI